MLRRPRIATLPLVLGSILSGCGPSAEGGGAGVDTGISWPMESSSGAQAETDGILDVGEGHGLHCGHQTFPLTAEPPQIVLLLDKSWSMANRWWDHDDDPTTPPVTRWSSLYHVVEALAQDATGSSELGVVLFPSSTLTSNDPGTACTVDPEPDVPVGSFDAESVAEVLPGSDLALFGGTPAGRGFEVALAHLEQIDDGRPQAVVLITDGAANCMEGTEGTEVFDQYDDQLEPRVAQAFAAGIPTYVVGVDIVDAWEQTPVANPYQSLTAIALAGGVPQPGSEPFYNTRDQDELRDVLGLVTDQHPCRFGLVSPPEWDEQLRVLVDGEELSWVPSCEAGTGWRYVGAAPPYEAIELCEATCERATAHAELEVEYACRPVP